MKLHKAIEILEGSIKSPVPDYNPDLQDAVKLGIEALHRILKERRLEGDPDWGHLYSETKD